MEYLVSVIVPVFNAEKYLKKCIESVLVQTYQNWELVLVDDGSFDLSPKICDEYVILDNRIRVYHKKNTGVSDSRNFALDNIYGDYVIFLDADDFWCDNKVLEQLVKISVLYNLDIVRGEYKNVSENDEILNKKLIHNECVKYEGKILSSYKFLKYAIKDEFFLVLCLFKVSIFSDVRFEVGRIFLEDMQLFSLILIKDLRCMYLPNMCFYAYRRYDGSVSSKVNYQKINDSFGMCDFFNDLAEKTLDNNMRQYFHNKSVRLYYTTLETLSYESYYLYRKKCIKELDLVTKRKKIYSWIRKYNINEMSIVYRLSPFMGIYYFMLRHCLSVMKCYLTSFIFKK